MERELPEIEIEGTTFQFDINQLALIEKDRPKEQNPVFKDNKLFFDEMNDCGTYYEFVYNRNSKRLDQLRTLNGIDAYITGKHSFSIVTVPRIGEIDPIGMSEKYKCSLDDIRQKSDFEIIVNQDVYNRRLNGEPVTIDLAGKTYEIDVKNNILLPQDGKGETIFLNRYHYDYYYEDTEVYHLFYNISENKVADVIRDGTNGRTEDRVILEVPNLVYLDPIGTNIEFGYHPKSGLLYEDALTMNHIAKPVPWNLYNITVSNKKATNHEALDLRINKGFLPTIEIEGHTFYVDIQMDKLRPKDDFLSKGIVFSEIEKYYDLEDRLYTIPYNPKTHEFHEPDYKNLKELPKDLVAVQFLSERLLDRIGWNRKYGMEITHGVNKSDFKIHFAAKNIPWEKTFLADLIRRNPDSGIKLKSNSEKQQPTDPKHSKSRGRKM